MEEIKLEEETSFKFDNEGDNKEEEPLIDPQADENIRNFETAAPSSMMFPTDRKTQGLMHFLHYLKLSNVSRESKQIGMETLYFVLLLFLCEFDRQINYFFIGKLDSGDQYLAAMGVVNFFTHVFPIAINFVSYTIL